MWNNYSLEFIKWIFIIYSWSKVFREGQSFISRTLKCVFMYSKMYYLCGITDIYDSNQNQS